MVKGIHTIEIIVDGDLWAKFRKVSMEDLDFLSEALDSMELEEVEV